LVEFVTKVGNEIFEVEPGRGGGESGGGGGSGPGISRAYMSAVSWDSSRRGLAALHLAAASRTLLLTFSHPDLFDRGVQYSEIPKAGWAGRARGERPELGAGRFRSAGTGVDLLLAKGAGGGRAGEDPRPTRGWGPI